MISFERMKNIHERVELLGIDVVAMQEGVSTDTIKDYEYRHKNAIEEIPTAKERWEELETSATGSVVTAVKPGTLLDATKLFKVDTSIWEAEKMIINDYSMPSKNGLVPAYQVKVWFKKRKQELNLEELAKMFHDAIGEYIPVEHPEPDMKEAPDDLLAEINIADLHLGKLAWASESGENYDIKIAAKVFMDLLEDLINKIRPYNYERILFVVGNDFFQADTPKDTTTHGTQVDSDVRWPKRITVGHAILVSAIERLRLEAPVTVKVVLGNHDETTMFTAGEYIKAWFRNDDLVEIDNEPSPRKYYAWNDLLLGFSHGHKEKAVDLFALMANEMAYVWSNILFKEFHLGHYHHEKSIDYKGLVVRYIKSPTGTDSWHCGKGFIGQVKGAEAFIYEKGCGLIAHIHSNLKPAIGV